jgi:hypothetical protein
MTVGLATPIAWKWIEPFPTGPDYRIPYTLSKDYWLYERRLNQIADRGNIMVLGDSVVWGEYVRPDGTLTHFLNRESTGDRFVNAGINGLFPLAMQGLVEHYGAALHDRRIIVHCNVLWMSSPKADLSADEEISFNHSRLVPQFWPKIPCYRANANERLSAVIEHHASFFQWVEHIQTAYYGDKSIPQWTLEDDGNEPPNYPNAYRNPLAPLRDGIPSEPANDPQRGPDSRRHKSWTARGEEPTEFEWVPLDHSLQWHAFQKVIDELRSRRNDVLVIVGPFNEHMIAPDNRPAFRELQGEIVAWLAANHVVTIVLQTLPSELYADASHPLTEGYALLAQRLIQDHNFGAWSH